MEIVYTCTVTPAVEEVITLYENAALPRPTKDAARMQQMLDNSDIILTAWHEDKLVGLARSITDWVWCCYLADLAVRSDYQKLGIGRNLIEQTQEKLNGLSNLMLLSVPDAMEYYTKIGMQAVDNGFILSRKK